MTPARMLAREFDNDNKTQSWHLASYADSFILLSARLCP
jgi:hypothetical protein